MIFNVGDKVRVHDLDWFESNTKKSVEAYYLSGNDSDATFDYGMVSFAGRYVTIAEVLSWAYRIVEDGGAYFWQDWMFDKDSISQSFTRFAPLDSSVRLRKEVSSSRGLQKDPIREKIVTFLKSVPSFTDVPDDENGIKKEVFGSDHYSYWYSERAPSGQNYSVEFHVDPSDRFAEVYVEQAESGKVLDHFTVNDVMSLSDVDADRIDRDLMRDSGSRQSASASFIRSAAGKDSVQDYFSSLDSQHVFEWDNVGDNFESSTIVNGVTKDVPGLAENLSKLPVRRIKGWNFFRMDYSCPAYPRFFVAVVTDRSYTGTGYYLVNTEGYEYPRYIASIPSYAGFIKSSVGMSLIKSAVGLNSNVVRVLKDEGFVQAGHDIPKNWIIDLGPVSQDHSDKHFCFCYENAGVNYHDELDASYLNSLEKVDSLTAAICVDWYNRNTDSHVSISSSLIGSNGSHSSEIDEIMYDGSLPSDKIKKIMALGYSWDDAHNMVKAKFNLSASRRIRAIKSDYTSKYKWNLDSSSGVVITDLVSGKDVYLQPGDDANSFISEMDNSAATDDSRDSIISEYFAN